MRSAASLLIGLGVLAATVACGGGGSGAEGGAGGVGLPGSHGGNNGGGNGANNASTGGAQPVEPQGWVHILDPGQTVDGENSDGDGWCAGGEGPYACDDGAPPGSGGTPPPGWSSSSSGNGGNNNGNSSSSGGAVTSGGPVCQEESFNTGSRVTPQLLLVVDKSGSMEEMPSGSSSTKWSQIVRVVNNITAALQSQVDFGLALFPSGGANSCSAGDVVVNIGGNRAFEIGAALALSGPGGGTPTGESLQTALSYLATRDTSRPRAVVLATDGAPNCATGYDPGSCVCTNASGCDDSRSCLDQSGAVGAVQALTAAGISTFVVGIPGTDAFGAVLDQMSIAGGTALPAGGPRYYRTESEADLNAALDAISTRVASCRFQLMNPPDANESISVSIDGLTQNRAPFHSDGWDLTGNQTVEFFGSACAQLSNGGAHTVDVQYCWRAGG